MGRRTVSISDEVYGYIAERGRFGESIDDALRRLFELTDEADGRPVDHGVPSPQVPAVSARIASVPEKASSRTRGRYATRRMSARLADGLLRVSFEGHPENSWLLPNREDHAAIAALSLEAQGWAEPHGASYGQLKAIHKALTEGGYYNTGPRR